MRRDLWNCALLEALPLDCGAEDVSILLSMLPSPTMKALGYRLRTTMGRKLFDNQEVEEARDRAVDIWSGVVGHGDGFNNG